MTVQTISQYSYVNVADFLLREKAGARIALQFLNRSYTYGELEEAVNRIAAYCVEIDCKKGDRALLICDNTFFWVSCYLGFLRAGLVCVPLPPTLSEEDLRYILEITRPQLAALRAGFATRNAAQIAGCHLITDREIQSITGVSSQLHLDRLLSEVPATSPETPSTQSADLAALMFTSGSTGRPRGVMVSHGNIVANTESIIASLGLTSSDRIMAVLPFHYCFGTSLLHTHLRVGGSLVVDPRFMYPETVLQRMRETECTGFAGVPSHFQILLRKSSLPRKAFPNLRYVQQAGGNLPPVFLRELRAALPATQVFVMYGQTEATARLSCLPAELLDAKLGSIGRGIPGVKLDVLGEAGRPVRPGETGEIVAEGANVALGYWAAPEETAGSFRDMKLYTGDLATVDEDGFIYIVDRAKDFLKCGGKRISCRAIENQLQEFACVLEAAVVGTPDPILGEAVQAFLVPRMANCPSFTDCLRDFCKQQLPPQLIPREVECLSALPKNSSGKVMKTALRSAAAMRYSESKESEP